MKREDGSEGGDSIENGVFNGVAETLASAPENGAVRQPPPRSSKWGAGSVVRRDPHGLRRRRRRFRRREGRAVTHAPCSHVGDEAVISRECCAAFSLSAINQGGRKNVTWVSSMDGDRFYPGRSSWGVHCLLPTSIMQVRDVT